MNANELQWDDLRLFLAVHEAGSLSAAARRLGMGQPTLSRRMAQLERQVGEPLFARHASGAVLSPAGQRLLPAAQRMADWAAEAAQSLQSGDCGPSGRVRVAAPPGVALEFLAPFARDLRQTHPGLRLEVLAGVGMLNLTRGEADLSLRTAHPSDPDLVCLDELTAPMAVYVSASYAAQLGPAPELRGLRWISWAAPYEDQRSHQALAQRIAGFEPAFTSDDFNVQCAACAAGVGAMILPAIRHRYSPGARLVRLNVDLGPDAVSNLHLVCHKRQRHLPKVMAVAQRLREVFAQARDTGERPPRE